MQQITTDAKAKAGDLMPVGGPAVFYQPHAFASLTSYGAAQHGQTVREIVRSLGLPAVYEQYLEVYVDDAHVPHEWWGKVRPKKGASVFVRVIAHGGDGNKTLRTIAVIAITVAAIATGQYYAADAAAFLGTSEAVAAAVVTVGVQLVGNLALNALIPPQLPTSPSMGDTGTTSPRYQLTGTQNSLQPYANIPRVFGRRRMYPLHAAHPYSETQGNDEYLRICLCVGWGPLSITDIKIGETPIENFEGVEIETRGGWSDDPDLTLFTKTVSQQAISAKLDPDEWVTRTTEGGITELFVDLAFPGGLATFNDNGDRVNASVSFIIEYRPVNTISWIRPQWSNPSDFGGGQDGVIMVTAADSSAVRVTGRFMPTSTPAGVYEVRVQRATAAAGSRTVDNAYWSNLRMAQSFAPVQQKGLAMIAMRIKASGQLNGVPNSINCIATSYLPVYNPSTNTWSRQQSSNPAWAYAALLKDRGGQAFIDDSRIDLNAIYEWAIACDERAPNSNEAKWAFNSVMEGGSVYTGLKTIAAHARANFTMVNGRYSVVRDVQQTVPVQHITPRNSWGYSGQKTFIDHPHALRVQFVNAALGFQEDERIVYADGYSRSNATKFETVELPGCTSSSQAWREGRYMMAVGKLRPETHTVSMDVEALRCNVGDLVRLSHDAIDIGLGSARIAGFKRLNAGTESGYYDTMVVDEEFDFQIGGGPYAVRVRRADGSSEVYSVDSQQPGLSNEFRLSAAISSLVAPEAGSLVMFGKSTLESAPMLVKKIEPSSNLTVKLTLVDAQDGVYSADTGTIPAFNSYITVQTNVYQRKPNVPSISSVRSDESALLRLADGTLQDRITFNLNYTNNELVSIESFETYWRAAGELSWNVTRTTSESSVYLNPVIAGTRYEFKTRALSKYGVAGDFTATQSHVVVGKTTPPATPSSATATISIDSVLLEWAPVNDVDLKEYEVRYGSTWETAQFVTRGRSTSAKVLVPSLGTQTWLIKAIDVIGTYSTNAASATLAISGPLAPTLTASFDGDQVRIKWNAPTSPLAIDFYELRYGSAWSTATSLGTVKATTFATKATFSSARTFWVAAIDVNGNVGAAGSVEAVISPAPAPSFRAQVVDNNVLLYWSEVRGTLPTDTYEIRKGSTWDGGAVVGTKTGAFTTIFETVAGTYTYWLAAKDTAGNYGIAGSISATVSQPPDYVLQLDNNSTFSGTKSNMTPSGDGAYLLPVNTTETFAQHFTTRSWASPQAQVNAGYPLVIEPTLTSGYYEEVIDTGALLPATKITLTVNGATFSGTTTVTTKISTSTNNVSWTDFDGVAEVFTSAFRYVKYRITVTAANDKSLYRLVGANLRIDSKLKSDAGACNVYPSQSGTYVQSGTTITVTINGHGRLAGERVALDFTTGTAVDGEFLIATASTNSFTVTSATSASTSGNVTADANGTPVNFNVQFVDVASIDVTPKGTLPLIPVVNFVDVASPTSFKILLFTTSGVRTLGEASWSVKGY